ncbi:hypothetical protein [Hydrogenimonas sp.]|uniref:hypothetical protein n=1 Tax=Hydrogenimonas sp. TaxID=2231112 RepID=UPI00262BF699|nr:hypothetical protein [Hydrogenimonas sp.]
MKWNAVYLSLVVLFFGFAGYLYLKTDNIRTLSQDDGSEVAYLKSRNEKLLSKNRYLKKKNSMLNAKLQRQRKAFLEYEHQAIQRYRAAYEKKASQLKMKTVPYIGIPLIVSETVHDLETYCSEMNDLFRLEERLYGFGSDHADFTEICGNHLDEMRERMKSDAKNALGKFLSIEQEKGGERLSYWKEQINDAMESVSDRDDQQKRDMIEIYRGLFDEMNLTSELKGPISETVNYWEYVFGMR